MQCLVYLLHEVTKHLFEKGVLHPYTKKKDVGKNSLRVQDVSFINVFGTALQKKSTNLVSRSQINL